MKQKVKYPDNVQEILHYYICNFLSSYCDKTD